MSPRRAGWPATLLPATLLPATLLLGLLAPDQAAAQPPSRADAAPVASGFAGLDIQPGQWLAVGAGVVAGVLAVEVLIPTHLIYVAGGAAGGYLANIWYGGQRVEIRTRP